MWLFIGMDVFYVLKILLIIKLLLKGVLFFVKHCVNIVLCCNNGITGINILSTSII